MFINIPLFAFLESRTGSLDVAERGHMTGAFQLFRRKKVRLFEQGVRGLSVSANTKAEEFVTLHCSCRSLMLSQAKKGAGPFIYESLHRLYDLNRNVPLIRSLRRGLRARICVTRIGVRSRRRRHRRRRCASRGFVGDYASVVRILPRTASESERHQC